MNSTLIEQHNKLLSEKPEGASHDAENCVICNDSLSDDLASEGGVMTTYTEEQFQTAIADAVAPLQARIRELETTEEQAAFEAKLAEMKEPLEAQIAELQNKLDAAVLEAESAKNEHANLVSFLESAKAEEEMAKEVAARKEDRLVKVRELAAFPESHIEANADRWAAWDEETFDTAMAEWKLIAKPATETTKVPAETAMSGAAEKAAKTDDGKAVMREMFDLTIRGLDPRKV